MIEAARAASRTKGTFLSARYSRITRRRGPNRAAVAIANTILVSAWHMAVTGETYTDLGDDFYTKRRDPARRVNHHINNSKPPATPSPPLQPPEPNHSRHIGATPRPPTSAPHANK